MLKRISRKSMIIAAVTLAVCAGGTYGYLELGGTRSASSAAAEEVEITISKGNLRSTISGTGQLEPQNVQTIVPPREATVKAVHLTRNQPVKEGDLLLEFADSDMEVKLETERYNLSQLERDLNSLLEQAGALETRAPISGKLMLSTNLSEGSSVQSSTKIGSIVDTSMLTVTLPFAMDDALQLKEGDRVYFTSDSLILAKAAVVESVASTPHSDSRGNRLLDVTLKAVNDGTLDANMQVRAKVDLGGVEVESKAAAALQYQNVVPIQANVSGTISKLHLKSDVMVKQGDLISTIVNDTLPKDIASKQRQIETKQKAIDGMVTQLDELKIYAPFDGVFSTDFVNQRVNVLNNYPVGSKVRADAKFGAVASLDKLLLPIQVDELDITKVKQGMKAEIKVDAIAGTMFPAEVTQVSTVGVVTNGVTFYDVVLSVNNASVLKYGMTATADLLVQDKRGVVLLPIEALNRQGGKRVVALKKADGTIDEAHEVKTGISNSSYIEIIEGLQEGDQVIVRGRSSTQNLTSEQIQQMRQQFQGGGLGGATPGGGNVIIAPGGGAAPGGAAGGARGSSGATRTGGAGGNTGAARTGGSSNR
jgi:HlyD family secretion protein